MSRVLRGDPAQHVRPETRERILHAARELEYRPNAVARSLRTRRTGTIGLVVPSLDNIGFSEVIHGIQRAAAEAGKLVLVVEAQALPEGEGRGEEVYQRLVGDGLADGLVVAFATLQDHHLSRLASHGIPLVLVNRRSSGITGSVVVHDVRGSRLAVEHLVALGHQRIGYIGFDTDTDTGRRRQHGYLEALAAAGQEPDEDYQAFEPPTVEGGHAAVGRLLERTRGAPPTAIFVASLMSALGVRAGLVGQDMRIPHDISLVAFNDHPIAEHLAPPLTTVAMPNLAMGEESVRMLLRALDGLPVSDHVITGEPRLIVRGSTAPPSGVAQAGSRP